MVAIIVIVILGGLIGLCIWHVFFHVQSLFVMRAEGGGGRSTPKRPDRVSWREIEEPLLYGWEYRFRQSLGPIPEGVEALRHLAKEHKSYADRYYREARREQFPRIRDEYDRNMGKSREHMTECIKFANLYDQEVRKHYLLTPTDPIELPMKYKLPEKGPSNHVHSA